MTNRILDNTMGFAMSDTDPSRQPYHTHLEAIESRLDIGNRQWYTVLIGLEPGVYQTL